MQRFVVDASVFMAYVMDDEVEFKNEAVGAFDAIYGGEAEAHVPALFEIEVANILLSGLRRKRLSRIEYDKALATLHRLPAEAHHLKRVATVAELAELHKLTVYDAVYLDLAKHIDASLLLTFDSALAKAAQAEGIAVRL